MRGDRSRRGFPRLPKLMRTRGSPRWRPGRRRIGACEATARDTCGAPPARHRAPCDRQRTHARRRRDRGAACAARLAAGALMLACSLPWQIFPHWPRHLVILAGATQPRRLFVCPLRSVYWGAVGPTSILDIDVPSAGRLMVSVRLPPLVPTSASTPILPGQAEDRAACRRHSCEWRSGLRRSRP